MQVGEDCNLLEVLQCGACSDSGSNIRAAFASKCVVLKAVVQLILFLSTHHLKSDIVQRKVEYVSGCSG